ncbi:hypothetical protein EDD11_006440 [Mortierella claussenii]|nr:hypothetical protein EDD11_006440 [Mortierella claussenii]
MTPTLGLFPGDKVHALRAVELYERASDAKVNKEETELIPLTPRAVTSIQLPGMAAKKFEKPLQHLGVTIQSGGHNTKTLEKQILEGLEDAPTLVDKASVCRQHSPVRRTQGQMASQNEDSESAALIWRLCSRKLGYKEKLYRKQTQCSGTGNFGELQSEADEQEEPGGEPGADQ